jgi:hypothetical protein
LARLASSGQLCFQRTVAHVSALSGATRLPAEFVAQHGRQLMIEECEFVVIHSCPDVPSLKHSTEEAGKRHAFF